MRGSKTSVLEAVRPVISLLKKSNVSDISLGFIRSVKGRRDGKVDIKIREISGAILLSCTSKRYHQDIRIYDEDISNIVNIFSSLSEEKYRIRIHRDDGE